LRKTVAKRITLNWLIQRDNETRNLKTNDGQIQRRKRIYSSFLFQKLKTFLDNHVGSFKLSNIKIEPFNNESAFRTTIEFLTYFLSSN